MDVAARATRLRERLGDADVASDAIVITSMVNVRYLTGFTGSAGIVVLGGDEMLFVTDGRYGDQATDEIGAAGVETRVEVSTDAQASIVRGALERARRVAVEADVVTLSAARRYAHEWFPGAELVETEGLVAELRASKDPGEVARIERAASIADAALAGTAPMLRERPEERAFSLVLDAAMRDLGAEAPSFATIVASGPEGARPHHRPGKRIVQEGDLVVVDFGARVEGYCSDMTRTVLVGEGSDEQHRMWDVVVAAQAAGVAAVAAGVVVGEVDLACRTIIEEAGWGEAFLHATGHGIGLEVHERPRVARNGDATLAAGNVVTVEPGVYLPGIGGVRIEDTVLVTDGGCRALTRAPKTVAL